MDNLLIRRVDPLFDDVFIIFFETRNIEILEAHFEGTFFSVYHTHPNQARSRGISPDPARYQGIGRMSAMTTCC